MSDIIGAARTGVNIWYNDKDISADITGMLEGFEYNDFGSGKVDDIALTLKDPDGRWLNGWFPDENARIRAEIIWSEGSLMKRLPCGVFMVDTPEYAYPRRMTLKGTSAHISTALRKEKRVAKYKNITLKGLAAQIGKRQGVEIVFEGSDTPPIGKLEQKGQSDLEFLLKECRREGYALKTDSNRLVIYKHSDFDARAAVFTIKLGDFNIIDYNFSQSNIEAYSACRLSYHHPDRGDISVTYKPDKAPDTGQVLTVREHCATDAEALRRARARLELANRNRCGCSMSLYGDTRLVSGVVVDIVGWGRYDGRYTVDEAKHTVGGGAYRVDLQMVKVS